MRTRPMIAFALGAAAASGGWSMALVAQPTLVTRETLIELTDRQIGRMAGLGVLDATGERAKRVDKEAAFVVDDTLTDEAQADLRSFWVRGDQVYAIASTAAGKVYATMDSQCPGLGLVRANADESDMTIHLWMYGMMKIERGRGPVCLASIADFEPPDLQEGDE